MFIERPTDKDMANKFEREANYWREEYLKLADVYDAQGGVSVFGLAVAAISGVLMTLFVVVVL